MGTFSIWHWLVVLAVVLILFGGGRKLSRLMGDAAHGIKAFRKGLKEDGQPDGKAPDALDTPAGEAVADTAKKDEAAKG